MASAERHGFAVASPVACPGCRDHRATRGRGICRYQRTCRGRSTGEPGLRGPGRRRCPGARLDPAGASPSPARDRSRRAGDRQAAAGFKPPGPAGPGGRLAPDPRLLGRQPRGRAGGRRPGRAARSRPTGTASPTAASPMPAMPPTGSAGSAAIPSSARSPRRPGHSSKGTATTAWTARSLGRGAWNPSAMIDLCTGARPGSDQEILARRLQRLEMQLLLDATVDAIITGR